MEENSLNPGDSVGSWTVENEIANGCIYAVTREDDPDNKLYSMKIRESHNESRFDREIKILKRLNEGGGHPSFQKLYDYSYKNHYMVLTYADPDLRLSRLATSITDKTLDNIDINLFTDQLVEAFNYALDCGVFISSTDSKLFVIDERPFFIDVEHARLFENRSKKQVLFEHLSYDQQIPLISQFLLFRKYFT